MQYIAFIQKNANKAPSDNEWSQFFDEAEKTGMFKGGSAVSSSRLIGNSDGTDTSKIIGGFMRFNSMERSSVESLLLLHPVVQNGGTIELYEMPKS